MWSLLKRLSNQVIDVAVCRPFESSSKSPMLYMNVSTLLSRHRLLLVERVTTSWTTWRALHDLFMFLLQDLYQNVAWPLYKKYGHAFEVSFYIWCFLSSCEYCPVSEKGRMDNCPWCFIRNCVRAEVSSSSLPCHCLEGQAFKLIVTDPDSVLSGLTKEVKEVEGEEEVS